MAREMKNSGFPWIGKIPVDWNIQKVKSVFYRSKEEAHIEEPVVLSLARSGVKVRDISNNEGQLAESYYNYNPVLPGDLLINPMDLYSGANCSVSRVEGVISPAYINLRTKGNHSSVYYDYYFKTQYWAMALFAHGKGVSFDNRWTLNPNDLLNYAIPVPCYDEQQKIASFLDQKCAEIDAVIEKTKATIEEYKKLKQSVITEAVTKGIRGNRPMKDSGIDYLGEYPSEWNISIISNLFTFIGGYAFKSEFFCDKSNNQVIRIGNIRNDELLIYNKPVYINDEYAETSKSSKIKIGDILFTMTGTRGKQDYFYTMYIMPKHLKSTNLYLNQRVGCFRSKQNLDMRYYSYLLKVKRIKDYIFLFETGTANQGNLGIETIRRTKLFSPSFNEQKEIADYLDQKCAEIDTLIAKKTTLLTELETYKKSLIYEYVTGKKEVREDTVSTQVAVYSPYFPITINSQKLFWVKMVLMAKTLEKFNYYSTRVKLQKTIFVLQNSIGFDLDNEYVREKYGPLDNSIFKCENSIKKRGWIKVIDKNGATYYKAGENKEAYQKDYDRYFAKYDTEIDRIINIFKDYDAKKAEKIATLFGAWNDAIIDKKQFTDEDIVEDVLNNWHEHKGDYSRKEWLEDLEEMKKINLIPKGYGKKTVIKND